LCEKIGKERANKKKKKESEEQKEESEELTEERREEKGRKRKEAILQREGEGKRRRTYLTSFSLKSNYINKNREKHK
jgi:hypothetical protein